MRGCAKGNGCLDALCRRIRRPLSPLVLLPLPPVPLLSVSARRPLPRARHRGPRGFDSRSRTRPVSPGVRGRHAPARGASGAGIRACEYPALHSQCRGGRQALIHTGRHGDPGLVSIYPVRPPPPPPQRRCLRFPSLARRGGARGCAAGLPRAPRPATDRRPPPPGRRGSRPARSRPASSPSQALPEPPPPPFPCACAYPPPPTRQLWPGR